MADPAYIVDGVLTDGEAWVGIAHAAVSLPAATVTFTSTNDGQTGDFSQYMDLVLVSYGRNGDGSASVMKMHLNDDTTGPYVLQQLYADGASVTAAKATAGTYLDFLWYPPSATAANVFACSVTTLFDINSGKFKSAIAQIANDMNGSGYMAIVANTWKNQSAITEIDLTDYSGDDIAAGSKFSLFGILPSMLTTGTVA
tara:strand:+ start:212 stop:808 length:597 start_codon:yes stop_codon:yes gene_type:complete